MRRLMAELLPQRGPAKLLGYAALFWIVSTVVHLGVFIADDTPWSGAISWRKPIVFSLSIGLLLWAYGWVLDRLAHRPRLAWTLSVLFTVSSTAEIGLIAMQQWRGRPSHFNTFQTGDAVIWAAMGILVVVMSVALVGLFVWSLVERPEDRVHRIAIIGGLLMVMSGLGVGQWLISLGSQYADQFDRVPETVISGDAGVAKFPHAVAFHGIQVFMVTAALLSQSAVQAATAARTMWVTVLAYGGVLVFSALQSFGGRAPLDLNLVSGPLLLLSVVVLVGTLALTAQSWWTATSRRADADIAG